MKDKIRIMIIKEEEEEETNEHIQALSETARSMIIEQAHVQVVRVVVAHSRQVPFAPSTPIPSILLVHVTQRSQDIQARVIATWPYFEGKKKERNNSIPMRCHRRVESNSPIS